MQIRLAAEEEFSAHLQKLNRRLRVVSLPEVTCDITGAMKGKRTIASLEDAASTAVANAKVEANQWAEKIEANLTVIAELGKDHLYLFSDQQRLVMMEAKDLGELINARVVAHEADAKARAEAAAEMERERIRQEEQAKAAAKPAQPTQTPLVQPKAIEPAPWQQEERSAFVSVPRDEYERLIEDSLLLNALRNAGVDNWDGWSIALEQLQATA